MKRARDVAKKGRIIVNEKVWFWTINGLYAEFISNRLWNRIAQAIIMDYPTSNPLIPAWILIELEQKIAIVDI